MIKLPQIILFVTLWGILLFLYRRPYNTYGAHEVIMYNNLMYEFGGVTEDLKEKNFIDRLKNYNDGFRIFNLDWNISLDLNMDIVPEPRAWFGMTLVKDKIYLFGGASDKFTTKGDFWMFDLSIFKWYNITSSKQPLPCIGPAMTNDGENIYLYGGINAEMMQTYDQLWIYNTDSNLWLKQETTNNPKSRGLADIKYYNGNIYMTGGEFFDPQIMQWMELPLHIWRLNGLKWEFYASFEATRLHFASEIWNQVWYILGGTRGDIIMDTIIGFNITSLRRCEYISPIQPRVRSKVINGIINGGYTKSGYTNSYDRIDYSNYNC